MRTFVTSLLGGVGMALLVGGILGFVGASYQNGNRVLDSLGPLNGVYEPDQTRFLGAILAAAGSGVLTFALLLRPRRG